MMVSIFIYLNLEKLYLQRGILQYVSQGLLSTWKKWTREEGPGGRISGSVCGLDPKYVQCPVKNRNYANALLYICHSSLTIVMFF